RLAFVVRRTTRLFRDFPRNDGALDIRWGAPDSPPLVWGQAGSGPQDMSKQPKKKLFINKESIRRLTQTELALVRGGDPTDQPQPDQQEVGTYRECIA